MLVTNQSYVKESLLETISSKINWKLGLRELLLGPVILMNNPWSKYNNKILIHGDKTMGPKINVKVAKY